LLICTAILHVESNTCEHLLKVLFNLIDKPTYGERHVLLTACRCYARHTSSVRIHSQLLPQLWENLAHRIDQRRCLVADACGQLIVYLPVDRQSNEKQRTMKSIQLNFVERYSCESRLFHVNTNACRRHIGWDTCDLLSKSVVNYS
jgi:hypothetical protein